MLFLFIITAVLSFSHVGIAVVDVTSGSTVDLAERDVSSVSPPKVDQLISRTSGSAVKSVVPSHPEIITSASKNVTCLAGRVASLNCRIKNLNNNWTVSWIRHRDTHLLTVASYLYSADLRFRPTHKPYFVEHPNGGEADRDGSSLSTLSDTYQDWGLEIHSSQPHDSGIYECQVSTTPQIKLFVHLRVVEPSTTVLGGSEVFVGMGSTINLTCVIRLSPEPPSSIRWQHNNQMIGYDSNRGGVSVVTEKGIESSSSLLIQNARPSDSGKYVCRPENAESATVKVHVLNGESPAAMQHGCSPGQLSSTALFIISVALTLMTNVKAQQTIWLSVCGVT